MAQQPRHYHAFISYRHNDQDMRIARSLQKLLEKYRVKNPATGKKETLTVFRDYNELPASGDLGRDIEAALEASDYLILICSKSYRESVWCMREVTYFQSVHKNANLRILPIVTEGEPSECLPPEICFREENLPDEKTGALRCVRVPVEPMAADIRAASLKAQLKKLKDVEHIRIAAPILGVSFDTLYQRKMRERIRRTIAIAVPTVALVAGFGIYNSIMLRSLSAQQRATLQSESRSLSLTAELLHNSGDRRGALQTLMQALPTEDLDRPIVPEVVKTLNELMHTYQETAYQPSQVYHGDGTILETALSDDGRYMIAVNSHETMVCYDLQQESVIWRRSLGYYTFQEMGKPRFMIVGDGSALLLIQKDSMSRISIPTGQTQWEIELPRTNGYGVALSLSPMVSPDGKTIFVCTKDSDWTSADFELCFLDAQTGEIAHRMSRSGELGASGFSEDGRYFTLVTDDGSVSSVAMIDIENEKCVAEFSAHKDDALQKKLSDDQYAEFYPMEDSQGRLCGYLYHFIEVTRYQTPIICAGTVFTVPQEGAFHAGYDVYDYSDLKIHTSDRAMAVRYGENLLLIGSRNAVRFSPREAAFGRTVSFPGEAVRCFEENGKIEILLANGELMELDPDTLQLHATQRFALMDTACAIASEPRNGYIALVPNSKPQSVQICQLLGDTPEKEIPLPEPAMIPLAGRGLLVLSAPYCAVSVNGQDASVTLLDAHCEAETRQEFSEEAFQGINTAGSLAVFGSCLWDLQNGRIIESGEAPWQEWDLDGLSFLALDGRILPKGISKEAYFASSLQWWFNGTPVDVPMDYNGQHIADDIAYTVRTWQEDAFLIGQNGLLAAKIGWGEVREENAFFNSDKNYSGLLVFAAEEQVWRYVPSGAAGYYPKTISVPYSAFANDHRWIATLEQDGVLRIYDWDSDAYIYQYDWQVSYSSVQYMTFFGNDRYVLLRSDNTVQILDCRTDTVCLNEIISNENEGYFDSWYRDRCLSCGNHIAFIPGGSTGIGLWINTESWMVENRIYGLKYMDDQIVIVADPIHDRLLPYPKWTTDALIGAAKAEHPQA